MKAAGKAVLICIFSNNKPNSKVHPVSQVNPDNSLSAQNARNFLSGSIELYMSEKQAFAHKSYFNAVYPCSDFEHANILCQCQFQNTGILI